MNPAVQRQWNKLFVRYGIPAIALSFAIVLTIIWVAWP